MRTGRPGSASGSGFQKIVAKALLRLCALGLTIVVPSIAAAAPESARDADGAAARSIVAVIPTDSPPTYFRDARTGAAAGFAVDVLDAVARRAGLRVEYRFEDGWSDIIATVEEGRADVAPGMGVSREREAGLAFSASIDVFPISFFVREEHGGVDATPGPHTVGVIQGSVAADALRDRPGLRQQPYESFAQGLFDLLAGKIDAFACPEPTLWQIARESRVESRIKVVDKPIAEIARAIAVRKGDTALLARLNVGIAGFVGSPDYRRIYAKWYGRPVSWWTPGRVLAVGGAIILAIVALMAGWRYQTVLRLNRTLTETIALRRQSEAELQRTTGELDAFFDVALDLLCIADTDGHFRRLNRSWEKTLGFTRGELLAGKFLDFVHPEDLDRTLEAVATLAAQREVVDFVNRYRCKDGSYRWIQWRAAPDGALIYAAARDITEQRQGEQALREHAELLRSFLNAITESALVIGTDGRMLAVNETFARRFGRSVPALVGTTFYELLPPEAAQRRRAHVDEVIRTGRPVRFEDERLGKVIDNSIYPVHGERGEVVALAVIGFDITERKRTEEALQQSERRIRDIASALGEGIYVLDERGAVTFMNPEAERLLGWSEAELRGRNIHDAIHPRRPDGTPLSFGECRMHTVVSTGVRCDSHDEVFVRRDGTTFPTSVISMPLREAGRVVASVTAFRDITEVKRAEAEREKLISELQKALAEIKTLHGILPICSSCKKIRDDTGAWHQLEVYIHDHTDAEFSHGLCADCAAKLYPRYYRGPGTPPAGG